MGGGSGGSNNGMDAVDFLDVVGRIFIPLKRKREDVCMYGRGSCYIGG